MANFTHSLPVGRLASYRLVSAKSGLFLLLFALLLAARPGQAQDVSTYQFAASSGTFVPITGGINISVLSQDDAISQGIALPFMFYYGGTAYTSLQATSEGYIDLTVGGSTSVYSSNGFSGLRPFIAPLWDNNRATLGQHEWNWRHCVLHSNWHNP